MLRITIDLAPVTKKNHGQIVNGRLIPSKQYLQYEKDCAYSLRDYKDININSPINVMAHYYMPTKRRVDITNLHNALHDVLVKYGIVEDDNCTIIAGTDGSRVFHDKENPRTEIFITDIGDREWMVATLKAYCLDQDDCVWCELYNGENCKVGVPSCWEV